MAGATLVDMRTKVRRLTRSPSTAQISDVDIDNYINCFILYDMPRHIQLFSLRTNLTFFLAPNQERYPLSTLLDQDGNNVLDTYVTFHDQLFIAGYQAVLTQDQNEFYRIYPKVNQVAEVATGDGVTTNFTGTVSSVPVVKNQVLFSSLYTDVFGDTQPLELHDDGNGVLTGDGVGTINYITGGFTLAFSNPPDSGVSINSQTIPYTASRPYLMLYYNNTFFFRPVPDQPYRVEIEAQRVPTQVLQAGATPDLDQWWQYIAYGAAKKVFEDRVDTESVNTIMPEFKKQELLVLRRTIVQQTDQQVATIYNTPFYGPYAQWGYNGGRVP